LENGGVVGHWQIVLESAGNEGCDLYDPWEANDRYNFQSWEQLAEHHLDKVHADPTQPLKIFFLFPEPVAQATVRAGDNLGLVSLDKEKKIVRLVQAASAPAYFANPEEADWEAEARAWDSNEGCGVVIEDPAGTFSVVTAKLKPGPAVEQSPLLFPLERAESMAVFLRYEGSVLPLARKANDPKDSIRTDSKGNPWKLYTP
jgi:hypothetical protein